MISFNGKTQTVTQWAREKNMNTQTLFNRINTYKWTIERALTEGINK